MFFTTSDLIERMNSAMGRRADDDDDTVPAPPSSPESSSGGGGAPSPSSGGGGGMGGGFELHARMPDGSYRPARRSEIASADFRSKMRQASEAVRGMDAIRKLEWSARQRRAGNDLDAGGGYVEAMDVYLTCLVAVDRGCGGASPSPSSSSSSSANDDVDGELLLRARMEEEIQLPVLLNLALCAMKLGMLSKAEKFCDYAIEETHAGKISPKAFFRRGRVRMLAGRCADADSDFDVALGLLPPPPMIPSDDGDAGGGGIGGGGGASSSSDGAGGEAARSMRAVVMREKRRLRSLVARAERDRRAQKRAMERLCGGPLLSSLLLWLLSIGDDGNNGEDVVAPR